ncbi:MAG TPA: efflux RND transporter periplasmic adaptor subunit [Methylomirabilota bacterium]|nr:efflux RND transporter periplasmic adaptor subunit [Methylomirabilota bacterium]
MSSDKIKDLRIDSSAKERRSGFTWVIYLLVALLTAGAIYYAWPRKDDDVRVVGQKAAAKATSPAAAKSSVAETQASAPKAAQGATEPDGIALTVSGYIIARERIELSPRFMGMVSWIGVKKGDTVTNGQVVVLLDSAEYKARLRETEGRLSAAKVALERAQLNFERVSRLAGDNIESKQLEDDARLNVAAARATISEIEGQLDLIKTYIEWTVIRAPINGVVLEKLVDPNELVTPQSFGGTRGPSTALIALADPKDLQVECDLNEADVARVFLNQSCRVTPEAYGDKHYEGFVAEIAPEANRQKGTLQVKVQIKNPDRFLTPELSARVDFLGSQAPSTTTAQK